jgi:hypothetical protein
MTMSTAPLTVNEKLAAVDRLRDKYLSTQRDVQFRNYLDRLLRRDEHGKPSGGVATIRNRPARPTRTHPRRVILSPGRKYPWRLACQGAPPMRSGIFPDRPMARRLAVIAAAAAGKLQQLPRRHPQTPVMAGLTFIPLRRGRCRFSINRACSGRY